MRLIFAVDQPQSFNDHLQRFQSMGIISGDFVVQRFFMRKGEQLLHVLGELPPPSVIRNGERAVLLASGNNQGIGRRGTHRDPCVGLGHEDRDHKSARRLSLSHGIEGSGLTRRRLRIIDGQDDVGMLKQKVLTLPIRDMLSALIPIPTVHTHDLSGLRGERLELLCVFGGELRAQLATPPRVVVFREWQDGLERHLDITRRTLAGVQRGPCPNLVRPGGQAAQYSQERWLRVEQVLQSRFTDSRSLAGWSPVIAYCQRPFKSGPLGAHESLPDRGARRSRMTLHAFGDGLWLTIGLPTKTPISHHRNLECTTRFTQRKAPGAHMRTNSSQCRVGTSEPGRGGCSLNPPMMVRRIDRRQASIQSTAEPESSRLSLRSLDAIQPGSSS